jgi:hypothetical protein
MNLKHVLVIGAVAAALAGCEGGDVNLTPTNVDNSVDNSTNNGGGGGGSSNPCASYTDASSTVHQGSFDGENCTYSASFVGATNPLTADLTIPFISGVHIFQDSLFVGTDVDSGAAPAAGTGPILTIEAGNTLAFSDSADYLLINRGSQIIANGSSTAPITLTGFTDAVTGTASPEDVQLWGGVVINGSGITNNCSDAERSANQCHVVSEGQPSHYGGSDNAESSGVLRYVVVKHTGFEVAAGDELNGITFNAVGSGTTVENIEMYSTYDDGVEFFGGAVNITNLVAVYVRDDAIDFTDGYSGTITNALVIQSQHDGNRCIEGDNIGEGRFDAGESPDTAPLTKPTIANLTCILSNSDIGTHPDVSEGAVLRRGAQMNMIDSIFWGGYADDVGADHECYELDDSDGFTRNFAQNGSFTMNTTIIACEQATKDNLQNGDSIAEWVLGANPSTNGANYSFNAGNVIIDSADLSANANLQILEPGTIYTSETLIDDAGDPISITPASGQLGAVIADDDWTANWTFGIHPSNRGEPLWFE